MPDKRLYDSNFVLACAIHLVLMTGNSLMVHFARWVGYLEGDERDIGWIMGAGSVLAILVRPRVGGWIDRFGAKHIWFVGTIVFVVATVGMGLIRELGWGIYALRMGQVLGIAVIVTTAMTYVAQTTPIERRAEALGSFGMGGFLGMMIGPSLGDVLLAGGGPSRSGFVAMFLTAAALALASLILLGFLRRETRYEVRVGGAFFETVRRCWPGPVLLTVVSFGLCMAVPFGFLSRFADVIGLETLGRYFWFYAVTGAIVRFVFRRWPDLFGPARIAVLGFVFLAAGMMTYPWVDSEWKLVVPAVLGGAGHAFAFNTLAALTLRSFPPEAQGIGAALYWIALDAGVLVGGPLIGLSAYHLGYTWTFFMLALVCGANCLLLAGLSNRSKTSVGNG